MAMPASKHITHIAIRSGFTYDEYASVCVQRDYVPCTEKVYQMLREIYD